MEFEEGGHVIHTWKQAVGKGNSLGMRHIRRQLGIRGIETIGAEQSCLAVKERVIS